MKKRIISLFLCAVMLLPNLTVRAAAANSAASAAAGYLKRGDYVVFSPAEKWQNGQRVAVATTEWELTAQHSGTANGNDVQTWKFGVSDKFYIENEETKSDGISYVRIQCKDFRESKDGRYWDIEGRSKKPGGNLHVWEFKGGAASQWFYLEEDGDGDPETFFLRNMNSNLYLAPENYFKNPKDNCGQGRNSWWEEGCNVVQSNYAFRWRIQVLNRDAAAGMGKTDKYANWMSLLPDERYLSELNIPGTHDSGTANVEGSWNSSFNIVSCQKYFIQQQLYAGVRSLDIRTAWNNDSKDMVLVHGNDFTVCHTPNHGNNAKNKTFRSVLDTIIAYLAAHPTEAVILTLKIDGGDKSKGAETLRSILNEYIAKYPERFYDWISGSGGTWSVAQGRMSSPTLGEVRGRIVMMTRVDLSDGGSQPQKLYRYVGPDLTQWDSSYDDDKHYAQKVSSGSSVKVYIQDDYESPDGNKWTQITNTVKQLNGNLSGAVKPERQDFVFNYTSKTTSDRYGLSPLGAAKYINDLIYNDSLFTPGSTSAKENPRMGIVVMDYINKQLCRRIIDRNTFPSSAAMKISQIISSGGAGQNAADPGSTALRAVSAAPAGQEEIVWPESAELTYGYVLGEAVLHFAEGASGGREGRFEFANAEDLPLSTETADGGVISDTPVLRTLTFLPADGSAAESREIPVTVHKRPLPIKIDNYEVAYGDEFRRSDLSVTAGGYLLAKDLAALNETLQKYEIRWVLRESDGTVIEWPGVPSSDALASGTIDLQAGVTINPETEFPNYQARKELGSWEIVPRTVTVSWRWYGGSWHASLGNILEGDDVAPAMENGILTLVGEKAGCYQVAEADQTPPAPPSPASYPIHVTEAAHGSVLASASRASQGEAVTLTVTPEKGYVLGTLTVTDAAGRTLALADLGGGKYRFAMPASAVTVTASFLDDSALRNRFVDVPAGSYCSDAVLWAVKEGITLGTDAEHFSPAAPCTRGQAVTFLWRAAGKPAASSAVTFSDVADDAYCTEAVRWAASLGIVTGYGDGSFRPGTTVTREQMAAFLFRFAKAQGLDTTQGGMAVREFQDFDQISAYAADAMTWAVNAGILKGDQNRLLPQSPCTRGQIVTLLHRLLEG